MQTQWGSSITMVASLVHEGVPSTTKTWSNSKERLKLLWCVKLRRLNKELLRTTTSWIWQLRTRSVYKQPAPLKANVGARFKQDHQLVKRKAVFCHHAQRSTDDEWFQWWSREVEREWMFNFESINKLTSLKIHLHTLMGFWGGSVTNRATPSSWEKGEINIFFIQWTVSELIK